MTDPETDRLNLQDVFGPEAGNAPTFVYFQVSDGTATLFADPAGNASGGYGGTALATFALTQNLSPADLLAALLSEQQTIL